MQAKTKEGKTLTISILHMQGFVAESITFTARDAKMLRNMHAHRPQDTALWLENFYYRFEENRLAEQACMNAQSANFSDCDESTRI